MADITESSTTVTKATVILDKTSDWDDWLYIVKSQAEDAEILDLIGLENPVIEEPPLIDPRKPQSSDVLITAVTVADLDAAQFSIFKFLCDKYKVELHFYKRADDKRQRKEKR